MSDALDYDQMILLDAEDLAEAGIREAYESMLPSLQKYVPQPSQVEEVTDNSVGKYAVKSGTKEFVIYAPGLDDKGGESWGRATVAFFTIINEQLAHSQYRFYAINGGNDLGGMFLTPSQAVAAQKALPNKTDWPYIPKDEPGWYGQYHSRFLIEDEFHDDWHGKFDSIEAVEHELRRLAAVPWDQEPNQAPCQSWATCGRNYVVIDSGDSQTPSSCKSALDISKTGVLWHEPFRP